MWQRKCLILCCICVSSKPKMAINQEDLDKQHFAHCTTKLITFGQTWTIDDIHSACADTFTGFPVMLSAKFMAPPDQITNSVQEPVWFQLKLYPKGKSAENADFIGIILHMVESVDNRDDLLVQFWLSFVDAKGDKRSRFHVLRLFQPSDGPDSGWGSYNLIRRAELLDHANAFLQDGKLVVNCEMGIFKCTEATKSIGVSTLAQQLADKLYDPLSVPVDKWIANLLDSGAHADVTLVLVDDAGQELQAHKLILITRSQVFADMFESKMAESVTNRVEIVETRMEVFKQALHFIYTGKVATSLDTTAKDLLICADKFQLDPLKSICEEFLASSITTESNLSDLLALANLHNAPKLMAKVVDSMRKKVEAQLQNVDKMMLVDRFLSSLDFDKEDLLNEV